MIHEKIFSPFQIQRSSIVIEQQIKQAIFDNHYKIGDKLPPERELAGIFGSRGSVREALRSLEKAGFVVIKKGARGGAYVSTVNSRLAVDSLKDMLRLGQVDLQEVLHARLILEPPIAAEAALKATREDIARLEEANRIVRDGYKGEAAVENNPILHKELAEITGNRVLSIMMNVLMEIHASRMKDIRLDSRGKKMILDHHERIVAAIKKRDKESASENMKKHILETHDLLLKAESRTSSSRR